MQYSAFRRSESTIWLRSDSYARLNHHCLGPSDVSPAVGCVNPGSDYFHTTGPIARDDETRRIDGSVHKKNRQEAPAAAGGTCGHVLVHSINWLAKRKLLMILLYICVT